MPKFLVSSRPCHSGSMPWRLPWWGRAGTWPARTARTSRCSRSRRRSSCRPSRRRRRRKSRVEPAPAAAPHPPLASLPGGARSRRASARSRDRPRAREPFPAPPPEGRGGSPRLAPGEGVPSEAAPPRGRPCAGGRAALRHGLRRGPGRRRDAKRPRRSVPSSPRPSILADVDGAVVAARDVDRAARLATALALVYPADARSQGIEADVTVEIVVDETGRVLDAHPLRRVGYGLDDAAVTALRSARFQPAERHGRRVRVRMPWHVRFALQ